jgi:hypothetical protein
VSSGAEPTLRGIDHVRDLLDRLRLDRAARARGAVIVEGPGDERILEETLRGLELSFFPVAGRPNVFRAADELGRLFLPGVICLADTDFDEEASARQDCWFLIFTDNADLSAMLFFSPALERFLREWASTQKLADIGGVASLRARIVQALDLVSRLRRGNALRHGSLAFDKVDFREVIDRGTFELKEQGLLARLAAGSGITRPDVAALAEPVETVCRYTGLPMVRGGDCIAAVAVSLRRLIGNLSAQQADWHLVDKSLRLAAREGDFDTAPFVARLSTQLVRSKAQPEP